MKSKNTRYCFTILVLIVIIIINAALKKVGNLVITTEIPFDGNKKLLKREAKWNTVFMYLNYGTNEFPFFLFWFFQKSFANIGLYARLCYREGYVPSLSL